jgi:hypothetical protein
MLDGKQNHSRNPRGACGCGTSSGPYSWQLGGSGLYTAAGSQALFGDVTWCGEYCGACFELTSTGSSPCSTCGTGGAAGQSVTVMITNLCPYNGNAQWCSNNGSVCLLFLPLFVSTTRWDGHRLTSRRENSSTNAYGYKYHFDIMAKSAVFGDNPVVNFQQVTCPSAATTDYKQCVCA